MCALVSSLICRFVAQSNSSETSFRHNSLSSLCLSSLINAFYLRTRIVATVVVIVVVLEAAAILFLFNEIKHTDAHMTCINIRIKQSVRKHGHAQADTICKYFVVLLSVYTFACVYVFVWVCFRYRMHVLYIPALHMHVCVNFHSDVIVFLRCGSGRLFFSFSALFFSAVLHTLPNEVIPHQKHTQTCALTCMCVSLFTP